MEATIMVIDESKITFLAVKTPSKRKDTGFCGQETDRKPSQPFVENMWILSLWTSSRVKRVST